MEYKFPRKLRLTTDVQFKNAFKGGKKIAAKACAVFCCLNNFGYPRLGIVVPKKNIRQASKRNLLKRIVRESFRLCQHELFKGDIVVFFYKGADRIAKEELCQQLEKLLKLL
jgi:ribonuclease P protein component